MLELGFIFEEGERVDECDGAINEVEGSFIVNKKVKVCCKKGRRSCFESNVCSFRNRVRTEIDKVNCDFKFESKVRCV